jgi:putative ABC transport system permease protein
MAWENIKLAFKSMLTNKLRTFLSLLGIVIGVLSVVTILTLGNSASGSITDAIATGGTDLVTVYNTKNTSTFTEEFSETLMRNVSGIVNVTPMDSQQARVRYKDTIKNYSVNGVQSGWGDMMNISMAQGSWFTPEDNLSRRQVVVLGSQVAEDLFPGGDAVGNYISVFRTQSKRYLVIGVLDEKDATLSVSFNNVVFMPYNTMKLRISRTSTVGSYIVKVGEGIDSTTVCDNIQDYLDNLVGSDAFSVFSASTLSSIANDITGTFTTFLAAIAGISLLVGGIGIMNIMLVSVAERTREIGIRKALGASPRVIRGQFITEAIALTMVGGLIGIGLGTFISKLVTNLAGWSFKVSVPAYALSVGFSMVIGVFFGWYPAKKAAKLDPIDALNYE